MTPSANEVYRADVESQRRLAYLDRQDVPITPELLDGALCLWRTNGDGSHTDTIRIPPTSRPIVAQVLQKARSSEHRVRGGKIAIRAVENGITDEDRGLLDRLAATPASTGYLMAKPLEGIASDERTLIAPDIIVRMTATSAEYLAARDLTDRIFRNRPGAYAPASDFYNARALMPQVAAFLDGHIVAAASILIVDRIANIGSVCTDPPVRGRGIASAVVDAACDRARILGAGLACLGTNDELARVGGLYHRLGFRTVGNEFSWTIHDVDSVSLPA